MEKFIKNFSLKFSFTKRFLSNLIILIGVYSCEVEEPIPTYTLATTISPPEGGKILVSPQNANYQEGTQVTLTPEPNANWVFKQWEGDAVGNTTPLQIAMTANKNIVGVFVKRDYPLNIKIQGEGTVEEKIITNPSGREYPHGTIVELTPKPNEGWEFDSWEVDLTGKEVPKRILVDKEKNVTVKFKRRNFDLKLTIEGEGTIEEKVIFNPAGKEYPFQTVIELTPKAKEGWGFFEWAGDFTGKEIPKTVKVEKAQNVIARFKFLGYKVNQPLLIQDEINYWRDCGIVWDVIAHKFNKLPNGQVLSNFLPQLIPGDFNNDGWIDIFNPGTGSFNSKVVDNAQWYIWNPVTFTFENKNLFSTAITHFGGNQYRSIPYDINKDGFTDVVILDSGDDVVPTNPLQPIRIVLSVGNGKYELKSLDNITPEFRYNHSGDIGDLNNDGFPDLVVATGELYISWGISSYPYFSNKVSNFKLWEQSDNGFGEWVPEASGGLIVATVADINKDGLKDIIAGGNENLKVNTPYLPFDLTTRILVNQGNGRFNANGIINLPFFNPNLDPSKSVSIHDFRVTDINTDGLLDIIYSGSINYDDWFISSFVQKPGLSFELQKENFVYNINTNRKTGHNGDSWKPWLILFDFNKDGQKDISYIDPHFFQNGSVLKKSVFIKSGSQFIEKDLYEFDSYLKRLVQ